MSKKAETRYPLIPSELDPHLDADYDKHRIILDLFRSINIGKMIAVIGSGVSAAYGYVSWKDFCRELVGFLNRCLKDPARQLDSAGIDILKRYAVNNEGHSAICEMPAPELLALFGRIEGHFSDKARRELHAMYEKLFTRSEQTWTYRANTRRSSAPDAEMNELRKQLSQWQGEPLPCDMLNMIAHYNSIVGKTERIELAQSKQKTPKEKISLPRNVIDPLRQIKTRLRISRFATFNYDLEIERLLEDFDYPYDSLSTMDSRQIHSAQSRLGAQARSISLSRDNASDLISLATMPNSEDATIVHIHGFVARPDDMVVNIRAYNERYIESRAKGHAFEDAQHLLFAGNAVILIGVGLSEEDLLRPLRYLNATQSDRTIYALTPCLDSVPQCLAFSNKMKMNYGINVIHFGWDSDSIQRLWPLSSPQKHAMPGTFISLRDELNNIEALFGMISKGECGQDVFDTSEQRAPRLHRNRTAMAMLRVLARSSYGHGCPVESRQKIKSLAKNFKKTAGNMIVSIKDRRTAGELRKSLDRRLRDNNTALHDIDAMDGFISLIRQPKHANTYDRSAHGLEQLEGIRAEAGLLMPKHDGLLAHIKSAVISTALCDALDYISKASQVWRERWEIKDTASDFTNVESGEHHEKSIFTQPDPNAMFSAYMVPIPTSRKKSAMCKKADHYRKIGGPDLSNSKNLHAVNFCSGNPSHSSRNTEWLIGNQDGLDDSDLTELARLAHSMKTELGAMRVISLGHLLYPGAILSQIVSIYNCNAKSEANRKALVILDSDCLFDEFSARPVNIAAFNFLRNVCSTRIASRTILIVRSRRLADRIKKLHGIEVTYLEIQHPEYTPDAPEAAPPWQSSEWASNLFDKVADEFEGKSTTTNAQPLKENFTNAIKRAFSQRMMNADKKFGYSIFCGAILETRQSFLSTHGDSRTKMVILLQHIIMRWMFSIGIPVYMEVCSSLNDLTNFGKEYELKRNEIHALVQAAIDGLVSMGLVLRLQGFLQGGAGGNPLALVEHARNYLAYKRGLSYGWPKGPQWDLITPSCGMNNVSFVLGERDYRDVCNQIDSFIGDYHRDRQGKKKNLRAAYALIRNYLQAGSALRTGLVHNYPQASTSTIESHIARLARLKSAAETLERKPYSYFFFDLWITNEIAVIRFIQGNFHDCVMVYREVLSASRKTLDFDLNEPRLFDSAKIFAKLNLAIALVERGRFGEVEELVMSAIDDCEELAAPLHDDNDNLMFQQDGTLEALRRLVENADFSPEDKARINPELLIMLGMAYGCSAQIKLLTAELDGALDEVTKAVNISAACDNFNLKSWVYSIRFQVASATGKLDVARDSLGHAVAAARGSQRPDLVLGLEVASAEFNMRSSPGNREVAIRILSELKSIETNARALGSAKILVSIFLVRARILVFLEQMEAARPVILEAITLCLANGMRLKRISALILLSACMAARGEMDAGRSLLSSIRITAMKMRYIRAVMDIERLERAMDMDGGVAQWAGYLNEFEVSQAKTTTH